MKKYPCATSVPRGRRLVAAASALTMLGACNAIRPLITPAPHPSYYSLADSRSAAAPVTTRTTAATLTLIVNPPHAAAGFDSQRIMYVRHPDQLEYFAHNEWIDTPARMLAPLIVAAVESSHAFRAVVEAPSPATGDLRLDTEVLRLQHEFTVVPSRVRLTLRAYLVESATRRVIASREFEATAAAASDNPLGGVTAATQAVKSVLAELAAFCAQTAGSEFQRSAAGTALR